MLAKRIVAVLTLNRGVLTRTKRFRPDYIYTQKQVDLWDVDEVIILDITRGGDPEFLRAAQKIADQAFVPVTLGGGIRKLEDVKAYFDSGADKITVNTGATQNPALITEIAHKYGSQAVVLSIDVSEGMVWADCGRQATDWAVCDWAVRGVELGAGEILLTPMQKDGSLLGYDLDLCHEVTSLVTVPVIILGGAGSWKHFEDGLKAGADGVGTQNIYHFTPTSIKAAKQYLRGKEFPIR